MAHPLPAVHLLTCPPRAKSLARTLGRWAETDWPGVPRVHVDAAEAGAEWGSAGRSRRVVAAFRRMLEAIDAEGGPPDGWVLCLEDDIAFHPRIAERVAGWRPLGDPACVLATLFNPCLREIPAPRADATAFRTDPAGFLGAQALLLRRRSVRAALEGWETADGMQSRQLAKLLAGPENPIWAHRPSLVQHVAADSAWGARPQRAPDVEFQWVPDPAE